MFFQNEAFALKLGNIVFIYLYYIMIFKINYRGKQKISYYNQNLFKYFERFYFLIFILYNGLFRHLLLILFFSLY